MRTLFDLCSFAIRDEIAAGKITNVDMLPLICRQHIFEVIKHYKLLDNENCVLCMTSGDFFLEFPSIDTLSGSPMTKQFWKSIRQRFERNPELAKGLKFAELEVQIGPGHTVYGDCLNKVHTNIDMSDHLRNALSAVGRNKDGDLRSLLVRERFVSICSKTYQILLRDLLNLMVETMDESVLERLTAFSFDRTHSFWLDPNWNLDDSLLRVPTFSSLKILRLSMIKISASCWRQLLLGCRSTLAELALETATIQGEILPFELPKLIKFELLYSSPTRRNLTPQFFATLRRCDQLADVAFSISDFDYDCKLSELMCTEMAALPSLKRLHVHNYYGVNYAQFERLHSLFTDKIVELSLAELTEFSNARADKLYSSCNAVSRLTMRDSNYLTRSVDYYTSLLCMDIDRAVKLRFVQLDCWISSGTLSRLLSNCHNIDHLELRNLENPIDSCLSDAHMQIWAQKGPLCSSVWLEMHSDISDWKTVIPVLQRLGPRLKHLTLPEDFLKRTPIYELLTCLVEYCPIIQSVNLPSYIYCEIPEKFQRNLRFRNVFNTHLDFDCRDDTSFEVSALVA